MNEVETMKRQNSEVTQALQRRNSLAEAVNQQEDEIGHTKRRIAELETELKWARKNADLLEGILTVVRMLGSRSPYV